MMVPNSIPPTARVKILTTKKRPDSMRRDVQVSRNSGFGSLTQIVQLPLNHPRKTTVVLLWLFGLFSMFLSPALVRTTPEMWRNFESDMRNVDYVEGQLSKMELKYTEAKAYADSAKVWFWRFKPEHRDQVRKRQVAEHAAWESLVQLAAVRDEKLSKAKSHLGVWSDAGVKEGRNLFWQSYSRGKVFAQRQTLWDAVFTLLNSRENDTISRIIELLIVAGINFTTGMASALLIFIFRLPALIASFKAGWISGFFFYCVGLVGGASVIATVLLIFYGGSLAFIYALAGPRIQRLSTQRGSGRQSYVANRPHYQ